MKLRTAETIMEASSPYELFSMDANLIEAEYNEYVAAFKPSAYNSVRNFVVTQKVTLLYRKAMNILWAHKSGTAFDGELLLVDEFGTEHSYEVHNSYDIKLGKMYVAEEEIIFLVHGEHKKYYENFICKTKKIPRLNKSIWSRVEYSFPNVIDHFKTQEGNYAIRLKKRGKIYLLREILNYFDGKMHHEHVAAIVNRLCYFVCYLGIIGLNHNAITVDNLFFAPGREVEEGEAFTVEDMRIVGVYGGWFFSTKVGEQLVGMPKEVYDVLPDPLKYSGYSSFEIDMLAVKRVARELLGDASGNALTNIPEAMKKWVTDNNIRRNAYEEYEAWEDIVIQSYGKKRFVRMDISI